MPAALDRNIHYTYSVDMPSLCQRRHVWEPRIARVIDDEEIQSMNSASKGKAGNIRNLSNNEQILNCNSAYHILIFQVTRLQVKPAQLRKPKEEYMYQANSFIFAALLLPTTQEVSVLVVIDSRMISAGGIIAAPVARSMSLYPRYMDVKPQYTAEGRSLCRSLL